MYDSRIQLHNSGSKQLVAVLLLQMENAICSIDTKYASEISDLLGPPQHVQEYFDELLSNRQCYGIRVKPDRYSGKGVYAERNFNEEELILKDEILVAIQHPSNKFDCLVCSYCFQFIGSVELQIGRKLYLQSLGVSASNECGSSSSHISHDCSDTDSSDKVDRKKFGKRVSSSSKDEAPLPEGVVESLMNGRLVLPYSDNFSLPPTVPCPGGCKEAYYCSLKCAEADWESSHSLLCTGEKSNSLSRLALSEFIQHATETNDIFLLAAKVIAFTVLRYRRLKASYLKEQAKYTAPVTQFSLLLEACKPIAMGYKMRWWDCISLPDDVDCSDEKEFTSEIRELAFTSLQHLKAAIFDKECEPLFSLEFYGHIIGMFELNNLDLIVESPVDDYFLYIDDLPHPEKEKALEITKPLLDALGDDYSVCCQGNAFYPLQSCMNHSCCPNAKAFKRDEDRDGRATIIATKPIYKGEEITISYIDEDLPYDERQASLADYGFNCVCAKCLQEESSQQL